MSRNDFNRIQSDIKEIGGDIRKIIKLPNKKKAIDNRRLLRYSIIMLLIITLLLSGVKFLSTIMIVGLIGILELTGN